MINLNMILKQGYKPIIIAISITIILELFISDFLGSIGIAAVLFMLFVYRNPDRHIFTNNQSVLSPIDGKVTAIDFANGKHKIYCKVNLCNVHVVRAPATGEFSIEKYQHGLNLNPNSYKASVLNEQITIKFDDMKLKLISGFCNPVIDCIEKSNVTQGDEICTFLDGIAVITVNKEESLMINIGDKLTASQTIIFKNS